MDEVSNKYNVPGSIGEIQSLMFPILKSPDQYMIDKTTRLFIENKVRYRKACKSVPVIY